MTQWHIQRWIRAAIPDDTVGALAKLLRHHISLVDDEVLVEDLEDLPALESKVRHGHVLRRVWGLEMRVQRLGEHFAHGQAHARRRGNKKNVSGRFRLVVARDKQDEARGQVSLTGSLTDGRAGVRQQVTMAGAVRVTSRFARLRGFRLLQGPTSALRRAVICFPTQSLHTPSGAFVMLTALRLLVSFLSCPSGFWAVSNYE